MGQLGSLEILVMNANAAINRNNFCFRIDIEPAVGNQSIPRGAQLRLEIAADGQHMQRALALHEVNRVIASAITTGKLASKLRRHRLCIFECGKRLA